MNVNTLRWWVNLLALNSALITLDGVLGNLRSELDLVERPTLPDSGDFLLHGSQETLSVEETGQPEGWWSLLEHPVEELEVSVQKSSDPSGQLHGHPGDFCAGWVILPLSWHSEIEDSVNGVHDIRGHDDRSVNGVNHVDHCSSDDGQNGLESLDFLEQENVQRNEMVLPRLSKALGPLRFLSLSSTSTMMKS